MEKRKLAIFLIIFSMMSITFSSGVIRSNGDTNSATSVSSVRVHLESLSQEEYIKPVSFTEVFELASSTSYYNTVYDISNNIGPRPYGSESNIAAVNWISTMLRDYYNNEISVFTYGDYTNVIGIKNGVGIASDIVIGFSGHFDTVSGSPGADDNGSGTALFLELARILSNYDLPITIAYLGCNAEEIGLLGSYEIGSLIKDLLDPRIIINADMILYGQPVLYHMASKYPYEDYLYFADLINAFSQNYAEGCLSLEETTVSQNYWMQSDQFSFYRHGIPSMVFFESDISTSPYYHSTEDVANQTEYNYSYGAELSAAVASAVLYYSSRLTQPFTVMDFQGSLEPDQDMTYILPALNKDYIASELVSLTGSDDVFLRMVNTTNWTNKIDFTRLTEGINELEVMNNGTVPVSFTVKNVVSSDDNHNGIVDCIELDSDGDALSDYNEVFIYNTNPFSADTDHDGLEDRLEIVMQMNPRKNDTDDDLMNDYYEFMNSLNPLFNDSTSDKDGDGLSNYQESLLGTFSILVDSDMDGFNDYVEVQAGTDPLDKKDFPETPSSTTTTSSNQESSSTTVNTTTINGTPAFDWFILIIGFLLPVSFRKYRRG